MLEKEFQYYVTHQNELLEHYLNKYLVIKDEKVVSSYDNRLEAYNEASKQFSVGTFLIQHCQPGSKAYTQTFHSRVLLNID